MRLVKPGSGNSCGERSSYGDDGNSALWSFTWQLDVKVGKFIVGITIVTTRKACSGWHWEVGTVKTGLLATFRV